MRILLVLALLLTVLVVGGLLAAPSLVDWNDYRGALTQRAETLTGSTVNIAGSIDLRFLPTPTLVLAGTTLIPHAGTADGTVLAVDRLDVQLKPLTLLRGTPEIAEVRLVRPVLHLERQEGDALDELSVLGALPFERLSVIDGRTVVRWAGAPLIREFQDINLEATNPGPGRPLEVAGQFGLGGRLFELALRLGRVTDRPSTTLQLQLTSANPEGEPTRLGVSGILSLDAQSPRLAGELTLSGSSAQGALAAGSALVGRAPPPWPAGLEHDFTLSGRLDAAPEQLRIDQLQLQFAGTEARGNVALAMAPVPEVHLDLQVPKATLAQPAALDVAGLGALLSLPDLPRGRLDLSIGTLTHGGDDVRRLRLTLALEGPEGIRIEQARAVLPGQTDVSFTGTLHTGEQDPGLQGELNAVTHDLRTLLGWIGLRPEGLAQGQLQTLSLASRLSGNPEALRLTKMDLRIDASHATGSLALSLQPHRQLAGVLTVDRLNLDAYRADLGPRALFAALRRHLSAFDVALEATISRLVWHDLRLQDVAIDGRSIDGQLELRRLAVGEIAAARAELSGKADLTGGAFELSAEVVAPKPARLLRTLGLDPPLVLARLTPVTMTAAAHGSGAEFDLRATFQHEEARLTLAGPVTWREGMPSYALDVEATHPDYAALLEQLGAPRPELDPDMASALSVAGKLRANPQVDHGMVGNVRLGPMSLTGGITWEDRRPRSLINARLSLGEVHEGTLTSVLSLLLGVPLDPAGFAPMLRGHWPADPLPLAWLGRFDGALELFAKGGLAGEGVEIAVRLDDRKLMLDRLAARLGSSELEVEASFDAGRQLPFLALAVDLKNVDADRLSGWLGLPQALEGTTDLYAEATSAGQSPRDLVRGLIGHADLGIGRGRLVGPWLAGVVPAPAGPPEDGPSTDGPSADGPTAGVSLGIRPAHAAEPAIPFEDLRGRFDLSRGIATIEAVAIDLESGHGELIGALDLLLWVADLELRIEPAEPLNGRPFRLQIVGALDEPQIRVLETPRPVDQSAPAQTP